MSGHSISAYRISATGTVTTVHLRDEASLKTAPPAQGAASAPGPGSQGLMSPLLYPVLALPAVYNEIFSPPSSSPWPFSYDAILQTAFAKTAPDQNAAACPQPNRQSAVAERIRAEIRPTGNQMPQMQKLGGAFGFASDYLAKACPSEIPQDPAARLQLMEWQIEKVAEALDFVRPPLQELEQSLNDTQRARFSVPLSTAAAAIHPDRANNMAPACAAAPTKVDASIEQISLAVQPTDAQRDAMDGLKQAFRNAANEIDANCPLSLSGDPLARLQATEARLDATWRALVSKPHWPISKQNSAPSSGSASTRPTSPQAQNRWSARNSQRRRIARETRPPAYPPA